MTQPTALITGVSGQDGWHLAEILLSKGYRVVGTTRSRAVTGSRIDTRVVMREWDLADEKSMIQIVEKSEPREIYNLASYSSGVGMYDNAIDIGQTNGVAVAIILDAICQVNPLIRFFQASSSEMFGSPSSSPQNEQTPFRPRNPYGAAKLYGHWMLDIYRHRYALFACSGILFNHESHLRRPEFVTRKVTLGVAKIKHRLAETICLGNLEARRDWGYSGDMMQGAWAMLQQSAPSDYVLSTGETHSVRDLCQIAFEHVGLDYRAHVLERESEFRPQESVPLVGDSQKARRVLGWTPTVTFEDLIRRMVDVDMRTIASGVVP